MTVVFYLLYHSRMLSSLKMEEQTIPDVPQGVTEKRPLCPITYTCLECHHESIFHQPRTREPENTDHRKFCSTCKKIVNHKRDEPAH